MHINLTGHHIEITPALRNFTNDKFDKLKRHSDKITSINVTFGVEKLKQVAEANVHITGTQLHARSESEDMYNAIDLLIDKLDRQLIKHKEKESDHRA